MKLIQAGKIQVTVRDECPPTFIYYMTTILNAKSTLG